MEVIGIRAARSAGGLWKELTSHGVSDMASGLAAATLAFRRVALTRSTWAPLLSFFRSYAARLAALYAVVGGAGLTVLAPLTGLLAVLNPGLLASIVSFFLPHAAFDATIAANPALGDELFFRTLTGIDQEYSAHLRERLGGHARRAGGRGPLARALSKRFARLATFGECLHGTCQPHACVRSYGGRLRQCT
jgi:hypothetical protein